VIAGVNDAEPGASGLPCARRPVWVGHPARRASVV